MAAHPHQQRLSGEPRLTTLGGYSKATKLRTRVVSEEASGKPGLIPSLGINEHSSLVVTVETTGGIWTSTPTSSNKMPLPLPDGIVSEESGSLSLLCG